MRTAIDSMVLLDVLSADRRFGEESRAALRAAYATGALMACDIVWAEVRAHFATDTDFIAAMAPLGVRFEPISAEAALTAGRLWRHRREAGVSRRDRVVADFLIGAHALVHGDALLTRDRGFYRGYFRELRIIDPSAV